MRQLKIRQHVNRPVLRVIYVRPSISKELNVASFKGLLLQGSFQLQVMEPLENLAQSK
jgi:hypothetical protein